MAKPKPYQKRCFTCRQYFTPNNDNRQHCKDCKPPVSTTVKKKTPVKQEKTALEKLLEMQEQKRELNKLRHDITELRTHLRSKTQLFFSKLEKHLEG